MITQDRLKELLNYDQETGLFIHNFTHGSGKQGQNAGCRSHKGYIFIGADNHLYLAHRLAFVFMTGLFPFEQVDHINGNRADNRWINLREATNTLNMENIKKAYKTNTSGFLGVHFRNNNKTNPWIAEIKTAGRSVHIGYYSTQEAAHEAYLQTKRRLHQGCTI